MIRAKNAFAAPLIAFVLLLVLAAAAQASTIDVNVTGDPAGTGDCQTTDSSCSLRQAITTAQPGDTLQLQGSSDSPVTYTLTQGTNLEISEDVTVEGDGPDATVIDGSGNTARILRVDNGTVLIEHLSMINGVDGNDETCSSGCSTINSTGGGSIFHGGGTLTLNDVAFNGANTSSNPLGGAISNGFGTLTMTDVSFTNEHASAGGALFVRGGNVSGVGVTFENNGDGGYDGGAGYVLGGTLSLSNSTIVGNGWAASIGGGIANSGGTLTLVNDTFSGNIRGSIQTDQGATTIVTNTLIGAGFSDGSDWACLESGRWTDQFSGKPVGGAITSDEGNNFDEDGHCGFDGNGDIASADPRLASIADNGGPTRTQALIAGSQAIDGGNPSHCSANDQRDIPRDGGCDIGAFQTHPTSAPATPTTSEAGPFTDSSADLHGTINLSGDAGGFHFMWGTSHGSLDNSTPVQGTGIIESDTFETQTLSGLNPGTTYFYKIVADNSSGSTPDTDDDIRSFTTNPDPPQVFQASANNVSDSSADLAFTINPEGADTSYVIKYGDGDPGNDTTIGPFDIGSTTGDQQLTKTVTDLDPGSHYHFDVIATNDEGSNETGDQEFTTATQIAGIARASLELDDAGSSGFGCPHIAHIDWGDDTAPQQATPQCLFDGDEEDPAQYQLSAEHIYQAPGHYEIQITYNDIEQTVDYFAQVSENSSGLSNTSPPVISGGPIRGQTLSTTDGGWDGNPDAFDYQWQDCDANGDNCTDTGEDQSTYQLTAADVGHAIHVIVTASTDGGPADSISDPTAIVTPPAPSDTSAPAIAGTPAPGNTLTCARGSWNGDEPIDYAFAWNRDGGPIAGAADQTYVVQAADQGHTLTCTVTASNDGGTTPATSAGVAVPAATGPNPTGGSGSSGGSVSSSKPTPNKPSTATQSPTSAAFDGSVNPDGLATTAHFEYGLDSKYTNPGTSGPLYDQSTPSQNVGSDSSAHPVSASVSGLVPNALYHVRLVATNSAGATFGPDATFTTPVAPSPVAPTVAKSFNVKPTQGVVLIKVNGKLVPLTQLEQIPAGAVIDALHGTLNVVTSTGAGHKTQTGTFGGSIFKVTQDHSGLTTLALVENAFTGAPSYASCKAPSGKASAAALSKKVLQLLHAKDNHGKFRTKGRYAAATTRGTVWTIADRCDGTVTHVIKDSVLINDFVRHINLILHAGHSYLALAKPPRHR